MNAPWSMLVSRSDLRNVSIAADERDAALPLRDGEALLEIEKLALTASNITYGVMGEVLYWQFFPASAGYGKIPAWGYARVERSNVAGLSAGQRLFGYLPIASHLRVTARMTHGGFIDAAEHRQQLPEFYNSYRFVQPTPSQDEDYRSLLLFGTSFLLDDLVVESGSFGAKSILVLSASSKTALGTAFLLKRRGLNVIGATSSGNVAMVEHTGYYDRVVSYDELPMTTLASPCMIIDFSGNASLLRALHQRYGSKVAYTTIIGRTHWEASMDYAEFPGPAPQPFFAPTRIAQRMADWGPEAFDIAYAKAWNAFAADVPRWLELRYEDGAEGLLQTYRAVLNGQTKPSVGHICRLYQ